MNNTEDYKYLPFDPAQDEEELERERHDKYPFGRFDTIFMKVQGVKFDDIESWHRNPPKKSYITFEEITAKQEENRRNRRKPKPAVSSKALVGVRKDKSYLVDLNDELIALFRVEDQIYAIRDRCPHAGGPLSMGDIEELPALGLCVTCPWHQWKIQLQDGTIYRPCSRQEAAVVYPVNITTEGDIYIGFDAMSESFFNLDLHPSVDPQPLLELSTLQANMEWLKKKKSEKQRLAYEEARFRQYLEDCNDLCLNGELRDISIAWLY